MDFLFSRNRLNVALSRGAGARRGRLLAAAAVGRAATPVEQMRLVQRAVLARGGGRAAMAAALESRVTRPEAE
jgi:hypothetical protein